MSVHIVAGELARWDALWADSGTSEALALSFFEDERPLRGAAGLADWRLSGRISRMVKSGRMTGARGEVTMLPPPGNRLGSERLFLFGLGASRPFEEREYRAATRRVRDVLARAGVSRYLAQPPGRATGLISARRALELWLDEAETDKLPADVTLIESIAGQKEMAEALRARR